MIPLETFLEGTVRTATPLAYAALGETVAERSGIINIGLEGAIIAGAFGGFVAAGTGNVWIGFAGAAAGGVMVSALFAYFAIRLRADQIITGTAISLLLLGLTATLYRQIYGATGAALRRDCSCDGRPNESSGGPSSFYCGVRFRGRSAADIAPGTDPYIETPDLTAFFSP